MMDDSEAIELVHQLVEIPSVSRNEGAAVNFLVRRMNELGFDAQVDPVGNAVGVLECLDEQGAIRQELMLLGHIDTVAGDVEVRIVDGCLYGRGAVDAKGPLAAFVVAASQIELTPGTRLVVIGAVEEEVPSSKGAWYVSQNYRPDACIIGEPSRWNAVTLGYKGCVAIQLDGVMDCGHSAGPEESIAERTIRWWNRMAGYAEEFNSTKASLFDQLLPSIRSFETSSDGLHDRVKLHAGFRLPPDFDISAFRDFAEQGLPEGMRLTYSGEVPAWHSKRTSELAKLFGRAILQKETKPGFKRKTGTSDMNVVGPAWQCPIVAYGPGDSSLDHTPNEHLELDDYLASIQVLQLVIESWMDSRVAVCS